MTQDWPVYGGQAAGDHYSPLKQINRKNVKQLQVAWRYDTGETGGLQTSPIVVGGVLYGYTPSQKIIAIDAATGKRKWVFDSGVKATQPARGLVLWTGGRESRILAGVMNYLYALDPADGKPIATFGEGGRVDLRKDLRGDYRAQSIALTSPGIAYKDLIIVGGRNPETHPSPPGDVRAFDVHSGKLRWSFHTIPRPGEAGYETWPRDAWKTAGAANNWAGMALDAVRGLVYVPTGSAVSDFYGADRIGDDLYADTLLALDAATGKRIWHFQGVKHDIWDRDFPSPPALLSVQRRGKSIDAVAQTTKQGYVYLFDRSTGQPLFPIEHRRYPASTVPGEIAAETQPLPIQPPPFARQRVTADQLTQRTEASHRWALGKFQALNSGGPFVPLSAGKGTLVLPGFDGGAEWGGPAVDPVKRVLYVNANEMAWVGELTENTLSADAGANTYQNQCSVCHGADLAGSPPDFPALIGVSQRRSAEQIEAIIQGGKGRMPSFPNLHDASLRALLAFLARGSAQPSPSNSVRSKSDKEEMAAGPASPPATSANGVAVVNASGAPARDAGNPVGRELYMDNCAICHGERMEGIQPSFPALAGVEQRMSSQQIELLVHRGRGRMPGFPNLQGQDLLSLLRHIGAGESSAEATATEQDDSEEKLKYRFTGYHRFVDPEGYPAIAPPWGTLTAIDLDSGKFLWHIPLGEYPELAAQHVPITGTENYGGPIVTASGLIFIAATTHDNKMRAFDSRNGTLLWEAKLPLAATATPVTYMLDGRQYVVVAAGGGKNPHDPSGGIYVAFALPDGYAR